MLILKTLAFTGVAGLVAFVALGRRPGTDGKPTFCGYARDVPFIGDLECAAVDVTIYFVTFVAVVSVIAFAYTGIKR
jgi:hypothetical protein